MTHNHSILVLGMHRSGTSALARVLGLMGAQIGEDDELLPPHPTDNPTGYWERAEINAVHEHMLATTGHSWDRVAAFDPAQLDSEACDPHTRQLRQLVDRMNADGKPWLAKDPRLCLLLSRWLPLLNDPACVVVVRDPREIAASLGNGPRGTFTSSFVIALWEKYLRTLLADLVGRKAMFVSYADMLADPAAQSARLLRGLKGLGVTGLHQPASQEVDAFLDPRLKRSVSQAHVRLTAAQDELYRWLLGCCAVTGAITVSGFPQAASPDAELVEFEAAFDYHLAHGRALALAESSERLVGIETRLAELLAEHQQSAAEDAAERKRLAEEDAVERKRLTEEHYQERKRLADEYHLEREHWRAERTAQATRLEQSRQEATGLTIALAETQHQLEAASAQAQQCGAEIAGLNQHIAHLSRHVVALEACVHALRSSWSWKLSTPLRWIGWLFHFRPHFIAEQRLYRLYYSIPGLNPMRKRALILWLHTHMPWLTRHTLSYRLYEQAREFQRRHIASRAELEGVQRMDVERAAALIATMPEPPRISIVMPVYNVERCWLLTAVNSVRDQFYPHWELCIANDASTYAETKQALREIAALGDPRVRVRNLPRNLGIASASNAALEMAGGEYVGLLDNDDELTRDALLEMACRIVKDAPDLIYSDEDKIETDGSHVEAHFKPDFSPDYLFSNNYICHFSVIRRSLLERVGGFRPGFDGAQDYDLILRVTEHTQNVAHIPLVLYHWRKIPGSTSADSAAKPQTSDAGLRALDESLRRRGIDAVALTGPYPNTFRVKRAIHGNPLVSIVIPFRDKPELLKTCVYSILDRSSYGNYEILCVDNGSVEQATTDLLQRLLQRDARVRVVHYDKPFNYSTINNFAARQASGEYLLLLNNDTEVIGAEWIEAMLEHAQRPEVGVVGAKLLYADDTIQHAGVIVALGGVAGHAHLFTQSDHPGYFARAQLIQNLSAVTFACAMVRREVFDRLGGLNEHDVKVAFNDVDFCLRTREAGYLIVYTPYAYLYHYESKSRGLENTPEKLARFDSEVAYMQKRHADIIRSGDPYYNVNLSLAGGPQNFQPDAGYIGQLPR